MFRAGMPEGFPVSLMGNAGLLVAARLAGAALNLIAQIMLARLLGSEQLGLYMLALSIAGVTSALLALGLPSSAARFIAEYRAEKRPELVEGYLWVGRATIALCSLGVLVLVAAPLFSLEIAGHYRWPLLIGLGMAPFLAGMRFHGAVANCFRRFGLSYLPDLVFRPALLLAAIALLYAGPFETSADTVLWVHAAIVGALAAGQMVLLGGTLRSFSRAPRQFETARWFGRALPLLVGAMFTLFFADLAIALLGPLLPADQLAIFAVAMKLTLLVGFGIQAIDQISLPDLSDAHIRGDRVRLTQIVARANQLKFWPCLIVTIGIVLFGDRLLGLFGPAFEAGHGVLIVLAITQLIRAIAGPTLQLLSLTDDATRSVPVFVFSLVALVALNLVLVPAFSAMGAAVAVLLVTIGWTVAIASQLRRQTGCRTWLTFRPA